MLGRTYHCSNCEFDHQSGWSHHAGGQFLSCQTCGSSFVLRGESPWAPREGEILHLQQLDDVAQRTTISRRVRIEMPNTADGDWDGVLVLQFEPIDCPCCLAIGSLVQSYEDGAQCPKCREARMFDTGSCIY